MPSLTAKEFEHLKQLREKFAVGTFAETDVHAAMVLLRFHAGKGDVRDLGDTIAHAERDRGRFFDRVFTNQDLLNNLGKKAGVLDARPIITPNTFAANLNAALAKFGLAELPLTRCDLVLLCGLSLIQGASLKAKQSPRIGEIFLDLTADAFQLKAVTPVTNRGKQVGFAFTVATAPNEWIPICNPRATLKSNGTVEIAVANGVPTIRGFKPFMVYVERAPPIGQADIADLLIAEPKLRRTDAGVEYVSDAAEAMPLTFDGARLIVPGLPNYFIGKSEFANALQRIGQQLRACVHDDSGAHWFLGGMGIPHDGFHSHWVGKGSATCTRPL